MAQPIDDRPYAAFTGLMDLASKLVGGEALLCSDDFFAPMSCLVDPQPPVFDPNAYTERGKLMDGWESRRRRTPGHDWCIIKLGVTGFIQGVDIDTAYFLGNHAPYSSIDGCVLPTDATEEQLLNAEWHELLPPVALRLGAHNFFGINDAGPWTHLRLHMYPDGGIARLRVYGQPAIEQPAIEQHANRTKSIDLLSSLHGGRALDCSDHFFGNMHHLLLPQVAANMGEGWESRRRRDDGHDWVILELGSSGVIDELIIDTNHFKGNYPDRCWVEGIYWPNATITGLKSATWTEILPSAKLHASRAHCFKSLLNKGPFTHIRLNIKPCGGVSRLKAIGHPQSLSVDQVDHDSLLSVLNQTGTDGEHKAREALLSCCHSRAWAKAMLSSRPFLSRAALFGEADRHWWRVGPLAWEEAFAQHPQIGGDLEALRKKFNRPTQGNQFLDWSSGEQANVAQASEDTLQALAQENQAYLDRFGFIFIVCATGKSADEMLQLLRERINNEIDTERYIAAGEQAKITALRLHKLGEIPDESPSN